MSLQLPPDLRAQTAALLAGGAVQREGAAKFQLSPATVGRVARGARDDVLKDS